jgi:ribosomal protein S19E (S16A)
MMVVVPRASSTPETERWPSCRTTNTFCDYPLIKMQFVHVTLANIFFFIRENPGLTITELQMRLGYSRGAPAHQKPRRELHNVIDILESIGYLQKIHRRYFITQKGRDRVSI